MTEKTFETEVLERLANIETQLARLSNVEYRVESHNEKIIRAEVKIDQIMSAMKLVTGVIGSAVAGVIVAVVQLYL